MSTPMYGDIEIDVEVETLDNHFTTLPNDLLRGEGQFAGLTLRARGLLGALLSLKGREIWKTSRSKIDAYAAELGPKAMTTALKELHDHRLVYTKRFNAGHGRFRWRWRVYMYPKAEGFNPFQDVSPGRTMPPSRGDGPAGPVDNSSSMHPSGHDGDDLRKQDVFPARTICRSSIDGSGKLLRRSKSSSEVKEVNPPSLTVTNGPGARVAGAEPEGGISQEGKNWTERDEQGARLLGDLMTAFHGVSEQSGTPWNDDTDETDPWVDPETSDAAPLDDPWATPDRLHESLNGDTPESIAAIVLDELQNLNPAVPALSRVARARTEAAAVSVFRRGASLDAVMEAIMQPVPTSGVQDWGRLLAARVATAEPQAVYDPRPAWCGSCDQRTRMVLVPTTLPDGWVDHRPARCPRCSVTV